MPRSFRKIREALAQAPVQEIVWNDDKNVKMPSGIKDASQKWIFRSVLPQLPSLMELYKWKLYIINWKVKEGGSKHQWDQRRKYRQVKIWNICKMWSKILSISNFKYETIAKCKAKFSVFLELILNDVPWYDYLLKTILPIKIFIDIKWVACTLTSWCRWYCCTSSLRPSACEPLVGI